jgi:hypothetical protein
MVCLVLRNGKLVFHLVHGDGPCFGSCGFISCFVNFGCP